MRTLDRRNAAEGAGLDASIVIPTFNRELVLLRTLDALARVDYPRARWEVIVVDDGSTDGSRDAVSDWRPSADLQLTCLAQRNAGPGAARNRGARVAQGGVLIFIDDDIVVQPFFLRRHLDVLATHPGCWTLGRVIHSPELRRTPFGRYRDACFEAFHRSHPTGICETGGISGQNLALPASDFTRLGGFDEDFSIASCEDWELGLRARKSGVQILYDPENTVVHDDWAVTLEHFCERQKLYSISDVLAWSKYGEASPRARLVRENGPVRWGADPLRLIAKKAVKRALSTGVGQALVRKACHIIERAAPDSRWSHGAYEAAVALAIFGGVREGFKRHEEGTPVSPARQLSAR